MTFKNEKELKIFLLNKCKSALSKAQNEVYKILDDYLNAFYKDYDPSWYHRTEQLLHSLVKSRIVSDGNGYKAEVYFNLDGLSYDGGNPSGEQVMAAASKGLHGAIGKIPNSKYNSNFQYFEGNSGVSVWGDSSKGSLFNSPIRILDAEAIEILKEALIKEGIPIK